MTLPTRLMWQYKTRPRASRHRQMALAICNRLITLLRMFTIKQADEFTAWLSRIKDGMTRRRLARRLEKAQAGNLGDVKPVGDGVFEMREHFGPGWRMYYLQRGQVLIVMLGGGDKSTQDKDIDAARKLAPTIPLE